MTHIQNDKLEVQLHASLMTIAQSSLFLLVRKKFKLELLALSLKFEKRHRKGRSDFSGKAVFFIKEVN